MHLNIYTDGGYKKKKGSWAFYIVEKDIIEGGLIKTSKLGSYEAELSGVLQALIYLSKSDYKTAQIFSDHYGLCHMINKNMRDWESNSDIRDPIEYWGPIWSLYDYDKIKIKWVSNKNKNNTVVDRHCSKLLEEARGKSPPKYPT